MNYNTSVVERLTNASHWGCYTKKKRGEDSEEHKINERVSYARAHREREKKKNILSSSDAVKEFLFARWKIKLKLNGFKINLFESEYAEMSGNSSAWTTSYFIKGYAYKTKKKGANQCKKLVICLTH